MSVFTIVWKDEYGVRPPSLIPVSSPKFNGKELTYLSDCITRNWITQGYYVQRFEEEFAKWSERRHAISCSSGTAALHLALLANDVTWNSAERTVVVPSMTYIASANAARYCARKIHFVDVDKESWCIKFWRSWSKEARESGVSIPVDLFDSCAEFGLVPDPIHDACHSYNSYSACPSVVSFYGSKIMTTGEGGMVLTDDDNLAQQIRLYRGQGATTPGDYYHSVIGYNYRMTDLQAAIGLAQLEQLDSFIAYRRQVIDRYRNNLRDDDRFTLQGGPRSNGWMFALLLPDHYTDDDRDKVRVDLRQRNIETRPFFRPLPSLPPYFEQDYQDKYPVSCELYRRGICLPTHCNLTMDDVDYTCETLKEVVSNG